MMACSGRANIGTRRIGISLLILSLFHVPLPQPDFHNVRHHDAPGELCEYHDHLLRWHPQAADNQDVATFHWHWVFPTSADVDLSGTSDIPALHAHFGDWNVPTLDVGPPVLNPGSPRLIDLAVNDNLIVCTLGLDFHSNDRNSRPRPNAVRAFCATFAPHASLPCLIQRWTC